MKNETARAKRNWDSVTFTVISKPGANWVLLLKARKIACALDRLDGVFDSLKPENHRNHLIIEGTLTSDDVFEACGEEGFTMYRVVGANNKLLPFKPHIELNHYPRTKKR